MSKFDYQSLDGVKTVFDHASPFTCLAEVKYIEPMLTPGVFYPKGSLIVAPETGTEPGSLIQSVEKQKHLIIGVTPCDIDLTETTEADNQPCRLWYNVGLDANYVCWPAVTTAAQIDVMVRTCKGCVWFETRMSCTEVPDEFLYQLQTEKTAKTQNASTAKTVNAVPAVDKT